MGGRRLSTAPEHQALQQCDLGQAPCVHPVFRDAARRQWGAFTAVDVRRAGLEAVDVQSAFRRGEWARLRRGVYVERAVLAQAEQWRRRHRLDCAAVLLSLGGTPAISHTSAARLQALVLPPGLSDEVTLTDEGLWRRGRGYSVRCATLPAHAIRPDGPFRVTTPVRTLVDCAREWDLEDAVIAMDAALQSGAVTAGELRTAVLEQSHWLGIGQAARAATLADGRAESPLETRGRLRIVGSGLPVPELQVEVRARRGFVARVDAWYDDAAVAVEFDGRVKYDDPRADRTPAQVLWEEKRREDELRALGIRVVRVVQADLGAGWPVVADRLGGLLAVRAVEPRRFTVVRRPQRRPAVG